MADKKPGKVLRVDPMIYKVLASKKGPKETWSAVLRRLLGLPSRKGVAPKKHFVLPSALIESLPEAKGRAVLEAAKKKTKPEKPVAVRIE